MGENGKRWKNLYLVQKIGIITRPSTLWQDNEFSAIYFWKLLLLIYQTTLWKCVQLSDFPNASCFANNFIYRLTDLFIFWTACTFLKIKMTLQFVAQPQKVINVVSTI